jgi:ParB family chromosome partitioning protein
MVSENRQKEIESELKSLEKIHPKNAEKSHGEAISDTLGTGFPNENSSAEKPEQKQRDRDKVGEDYALSGRQIAKYVQMANLIPTFIDQLDNGNLTIRCGVELSYLSAAEQELVSDFLTQTAVKLEESHCKKLRAASGNLNADKISEIIVGKKDADKEPNLYKSLKDEFPEQFRRKGKKQMNQIIRTALAEYFARHKEMGIS